MDTIDTTVGTTRSGTTWVQSGCAAALGVLIGFALGMTTLSSLQPDAAPPLFVQTPAVLTSSEPPPATGHSGPAATLDGASLGLAPARDLSSWTDPAPATSGGLEPCWATVYEPVHC